MSGSLNPSKQWTSPKSFKCKVIFSFLSSRCAYCDRGLGKQSAQLELFFFRFSLSSSSSDSWSRRRTPAVVGEARVLWVLNLEWSEWTTWNGAKGLSCCVKWFLHVRLVNFEHKSCGDVGIGLTLIENVVGIRDLLTDDGRVVLFFCWFLIWLSSCRNWLSSGLRNSIGLVPNRLVKGHCN